jgi:hypothetical protein
MDSQSINQGSRDLLQIDDRFDDFEPPHSTDGSYLGRMRQAKATEAHLQQKFEEKLVEVKARLKASNCKVGLKLKGGTIQLQATLPPKPDSDKLEMHQQVISLNIPANLDGLKTAEEEANELGRLIARKQFEWNDKYLGKKKNDVRTLDYYYSIYIESFFKYRKYTIKSDSTFKNYKYLANKYLNVPIEATVYNIQQIIEKVESDTTCNHLIKVVRDFHKVFGIEVPDLNKLIRKQENRRVRNIPSDETVIENFHNYEAYSKNRPNKMTHRTDSENWQLWRWVYGMLATFGLRPRELFVSPDIDWWLSLKNIDSTWKVHKDCKTGEREAFALNAEWIDLFDLKNPKYLQMLRDKVQGKTTSTQISSSRHGNDFWFRHVGIGFQPYDLRHAWAIRAHLLGVPIKAAADNLGHSVQVHTHTYQRWFGRDNRKRAINEAVNKKSEVDILKEENQRLKLEIELLKLENQRLKLESQLR